MNNDRVLVVDLDGTLLRSDMLFETFWSAFSSRWSAPFSAMGALMRGKAALKRRMADLSVVDVETLPYNAAVIDYVERWRAEGGRTALVTAADQNVADRIAAYLKLFDEVHGSDGSGNLKGPRKAAFLEERYGSGNFDYAGDAAADLPIWEKSGKAITVDVSSRTEGALQAMGREIEKIDAPRPALRSYLKAIRPHQWLKNLLVFLPMLAAHQLGVVTQSQAFLAFVAFSLTASSVYVFNDLLDLAADRAHPRKRNRPLASGAIPLSHGTWLAPFLALAGLIASLPLGPGFVLVLFIYYVTTTAYSLYFKRLIVIDIWLLAGLYTIRIVAGAVATGIPLSVWLLAFSLFFFFSLAAVKRQAELVDGVKSGEVTARGRGYHVDDLPLISAMAVASGYVSVLVMALYVNSPAVLELYDQPYILWGICPVLLFWLSRVVMVTHRGEMHDDPVVFAARDRVSLICFLIILGFAGGGTLL